MWLALAVSLAVTAQSGAPTENVGALLLRLQEESASPLVQHCAVKVPDLKRPLEAEYLRFRKKFRKATAHLREGIPKDEELARPASSILVAELESMGAQDLARIRGLDPLVFCPTLRKNLSAATTESMQRNMESAFAQYRAAARQGK
jgi:hypothetical protein